MKKIIKRFWGVAFVVVLLTTMLVGAIPQASADELDFGFANLPGGKIGGLAANPQSICANSTKIYDFAVANDGTTIYAASNTSVNGAFNTKCGALKSTNGGRTWSQLTIDSNFYFMTNRVAVAPDDPNIVAYLDIQHLKVAVSINGGATFSVSPVVASAGGVPAANVTAIAIAPKAVVQNALVSLVAVTGQTSASGGGAQHSGAALYYYPLNSTGTFATWSDAMVDYPFNIGTFNFNATSDTIFNAIAFTPSFAQNFIAYLIGNNASNEANLHVVSFNNNQWDTGVAGNFPLYTLANCAIFTKTNLTPGRQIFKCSIVLDPTYSLDDESTRNACISFGFIGPENGYVIQLKDYAIPAFKAINNASMTVVDPAIWSLTLNSDGSKLVAAGANTSATWTLSSPLSAATTNVTAVWTPTRTVKRSGGGYVQGTVGTDRMVVQYSGANLFLSRYGTTSGAFALSTLDGLVYNDISLVRTSLTILRDQAVAANGVQRYVVATDNVSADLPAGHYITSLFFWDGTYWTRVFTLGPGAGLSGTAGDHNYILQASPKTFACVYLADKQTANIYHSSDAGTFNWKIATSPVPTNGLQDMVVQDDTTLWVATYVTGQGGAVTRLTDYGNIWPSGPPYYLILFSQVGVFNLTLAGPDKVIATFNNGKVAYTNGGTTWSKIPIAVPGAVGAFATATDLTSGSVIYATNNSTGAANYGNNIYGWKIGTDVQWGNPITGASDSCFPFAADVTNAATVGVWNRNGVHSYGLEIYGGCLYLLSANNTRTDLTRALLPAFGLYDLGLFQLQEVLVGGSSVCTGNVSPNAMKFSADASGLVGNKIWFIDSNGRGPGSVYSYHWSSFGKPLADQIVVYTDTLAVATPTLTSKNGALIQVNKQTGRAYDYDIVFSEPSVAYGYQVQVAADSAFNNVVADTTYDLSTAWWSNALKHYSPVTCTIGPDATATNTPYHRYLQILYQPGETYYYRVRAIVPYYSPWSSTNSLTIQPIQAPVPDLYSPINGQTVSVLKPGFSWSAMGGATQYHFQIATDASFTNIIQDSLVPGGAVDGAGVELAAPLVNGVQYFWHVQESQPVIGDWSTVGNFIVRLPTTTPAFTITQTAGPTIILTATQTATSITVAATHTENTVNPSYIWAIIIIGAILVIAIIVLIFRTRRV